MGNKQKQNPKNLNSSVPCQEETDDQSLDLRAVLAFLFWGDDPRLIEPLSFGVLLKRILLVLDNLLAACFVILSFMILLYYGRGMDWLGAMDATENYICGHPVSMSLLYIVVMLLYWRPIKHTMVMPLSHYVTDLALLMFVAVWIFCLIFVFLFIRTRSGSIDIDYDGAPYWVSCLRSTIVIFLWVYRRVFLMYVYRKNTMRGLCKKAYEKEGPTNGVGIQSEHSTLWDDFKFCVFGPRKKDVPAESLTYRLTPRRVFVILDNLIAPAVCYYFFVWMKRFYYGVDCSFVAVVDDIFLDKDYGNILALYLVMLALFWRFLWYSDKKPHWSNFKQPACYGFIAVVSAFIVFFVWRDYSALVEAGRMQEFTTYNRQRGIFHFEHYVPLWIDIIRVICVVALFWVRRFLLQDVEVSFKGRDKSTPQ